MSNTSWAIQLHNNDTIIHFTFRKTAFPSQLCTSRRATCSCQRTPLFGTSSWSSRVPRERLHLLLLSQSCASFILEFVQRWQIKAVHLCWIHEVNLGMSNLSSVFLICQRIFLKDPWSKDLWHLIMALWMGCLTKFFVENAHNDILQIYFKVKVALIYVPVYFCRIISYNLRIDTTCRACFCNRNGLAIIVKSKLKLGLLSPLYHLTSDQRLDVPSEARQRSECAIN